MIPKWSCLMGKAMVWSIPYYTFGHNRSIWHRFFGRRKAILGILYSTINNDLLVYPHCFGKWTKKVELFTPNRDETCGQLTSDIGMQPV
jgi:hypothetical protein